jgi:hypothetical protein
MKVLGQSVCATSLADLSFYPTTDAPIERRGGVLLLP